MTVGSINEVELFTQRKIPTSHVALTMAFQLQCVEFLI